MQHTALWAYSWCKIKALANEDTLLRTHCCRHKCFPVCPRAQHLLRTQILCPRPKNVSDFVQKHFVSATNVSQFAQPKKHYGQQCVRNNVSSFTRAFTTVYVAMIKQWQKGYWSSLEKEAIDVSNKSRSLLHDCSSKIATTDAKV